MQIQACKAQKFVLKNIDLISATGIAISKEGTLPLLSLLHLATLGTRLRLIALILSLDGGVDRELEHFVHTFRLLGAAFDVLSAHLPSDLLTLLGCDGCETLCAEEFDAGSLAAEVGLAAYQDERSVGAEVEDFRIPLNHVSHVDEFEVSSYLVHDIL